MSAILPRQERGLRVPTLGRRLWTGTFWLMLLALAGLLVFGLSSGPILRQAVWSPLGLRRLALYACAYGGLVLACWRISWRLLTPLTIGTGGFLAATSFGFGPLAALVFYACSAVALGDAVFSALGDRREGASPAVRLPLVFLLGICVIVFGVGLAVHFPINYSSGYMLALLLPVVFNRKRLWLYGQEAASRLVGRAPRTGAAEFAARALLGFVVLAHFLVALKPEVSYDGLSIHLVAPAYVAAHHRWPFDVGEFIWAVMPLGGDWAYTGIYLLGGEYAARLTNFLFLAAILGMLYCFARRWLRRPQALVAVSLFASTPLVQLLTGSLFVENMQAAMLVAALLALERLQATREPAWLVAAGVFLGTSLATKFGSLPFVLPLMAVAAIQLARASRRRRLGLRWTLLAGCSLPLTAAPPYAYAWWATGNPVFPFLNEVFRSPLLAAPVFASPFSPKFNALNVLKRLTFHSHEFLESQAGALGFHWFLLVPLTAFLIGRRCWSRLGPAAITAATASVAILLSQPYLRYLYAALPFWSVAICCTIGVAGLHGRALRQALIGASVVLVLLNVYFLPASGWYHRDFFAWSPLGRQDYERYEESLAPGRKLVDYLNLRHPSQPVWFIGGYHLAGLRGKAYFTSWHQYLFLAELGRCQRSEDVLKLAAKHGLRHFIVASDLEGVPHVSLPVKAFLREFTEKEWEYGSYALLRLRPEFEFSSELLDPKEFNSGWPGWQRNGQVAIVPGRGARVTLLDTLVRAVAVDEGVTYRYSLEAFCEVPGTVLRLQINWHDASGKFITTSLEPRPCEPQWRTYGREMQPPAGATTGIVIVGGHGPQPVLVRSVSLRH